MEAETTIDAVGDHASYADLGHRDKGHCDIHPQGTANKPGAAMKNRELAVNFQIAFFRLTAKMELVKQPYTASNEFVSDFLTDTEEKYQCNKGTVAYQTDNSEKRKITHIFWKKGRRSTTIKRAYNTITI